MDDQNLSTQIVYKIHCLDYGVYRSEIIDECLPLVINNLQERLIYKCELPINEIGYTGNLVLYGRIKIEKCSLETISNEYVFSSVIHTITEHGYCFERGNCVIIFLNKDHKGSKNDYYYALDSICKNILRENKLSNLLDNTNPLV